ncbi:MAG: insulinase family protein, partial [Candidatus Aminicenantes bacterium]|nr:insulinase family protein [Candidatus Aminicenantes bacterium]
KIRTDEGLAYSVWGSYGAGYQSPGIFSCGAQTKSESTIYAIELMFQELKKIKEKEVSDEELAKAKDQFLNSYVFNFDSRARVVNRLMTYAFYDYPLDFMEKVKKGVEKVTKKDVLRVARIYLRPDKVQILVVGNKDKFDKPLSTLGKVNVINITIPSAKAKKK